MGKKKRKKHAGREDGGLERGAGQTETRLPESGGQRVPEAAGTAPAVPATAPVPVPGAGGETMYEPIREYRLKFYLNAQHYVVFDGKRGETHPHTWEFTLVVEVSGLETTPFSVFERGIEDCLAPFQNKVMNECAPFDTMLPTLENLVEEFCGPFGAIIREAGGRLVSLEGSEGPTRSYILRERREAQEEFERQDLQAERARVIDGIVARALDDAKASGAMADGAVQDGTAAGA